MIFYEIISGFTALLSIFLPETKGKEIPDTLEDVENLDKIKSQKLNGI